MAGLLEKAGTSGDDACRAIGASLRSSSLLTPLPLFPHAWRARLAEARWQRQTLGESGADVFRIETADGASLFLKSEPAAPLAELPGEIARLEWLARQGLPAPAVIDQALEHGRHWLLMSAVPGRDLASGPFGPAEIVGHMADALRLLHRVPVATCPFDHRLARRIEDAQARAVAGLVDESDFDDERAGWTALDLFERLRATRPASEDLVVTHGDACLPNLMASADGFAGFIDCGRLGVADRWQDLALAARSIGFNLGDTWVAPFFERYGIAPDAGRLAFYSLLDEFF